MDLIAYLLNGVIEATAPPGETAADAQSRADAIAAMLRAYDPADGMEAMMACQCVMMQFLLTAAMRDASNPQQEPAAQTKARAGAISASRTLHQWVTKFENARKRNELRAAEAAKAQAAAQPTGDPAVQTSPDEPARKLARSPADRVPAHATVPNGRITVATGPLEPLPAASEEEFCGTTAPPVSLQAEASKAA